jgi:hypothetical protein
VGERVGMAVGQEWKLDNVGELSLLGIIASLTRQRGDRYRFHDLWQGAVDW